MDAHTDRFVVMGADAVVTIVGAPPALAVVARGRLTDLERRWSRFVPTSEVSRLNDSAGARRHVSPETLLLLQRAEEGRAATGGRFDPWCLDAVEAVGYRSSIEHVGRPAVLPSTPRPADAPAPEIDAAASTVRLPAGARFDPGGIGKGLAADIVVEELLGLGAAGACVSLGGDVRVAGVSPSGDAWRVAVRDLGGDEPTGEVVLADGGVATTSRSARRWTTADGREVHHVIDPGTGVSGAGPVVCATAIAGSGWQAEVLATLAFLDGVEGIDRIEELGATARVVSEDGIVEGAHWARFAGLEVAA